MTAPPSIADLRREYRQTDLDESYVDPNAIKQFERWFDEALKAKVVDANAMTLATVGADGAPDARIVLLKGVEGGVFRWFTNYESTKGTQLAAKPQAALLFYWSDLERQVRVRGPIARLPSSESDAYFASRPRGSQIGAWASKQSTVLVNRAALDAEMARYEAMYPEGQPIPRPPHWGGYGLTPHDIEFWQGRPNRLHDRLLFTRDGGEWQIRRLSA